MTGLLSEDEVADSTNLYFVPAIICGGYYEVHFTDKETKVQAD